MQQKFDKKIEILTLYTGYDGTVKKTISRYCPFKDNVHPNPVYNPHRIFSKYALLKVKISYGIFFILSTCLENRQKVFKRLWRMHWKQGCEWTDKSMNRDRESRTRIGSDASFLGDSFSNLEIDDNVRILHNLGLDLAANISTALAFQPDRDREIKIILWFF